jgi:hypothetical protein
MIVRIQLGKGRTRRSGPGRNRHVALAVAALMAPSALMAYVLGFWRLAADMGMTGAFGFTGVFSHWQLWIALAVALQLGAVALTRYGRGGVFRVPSVFRPRLLPLRTKTPKS